MVSALLLSSAVLGVLGGARHALEPDHVAAICTLVAERPTFSDTTRYALWWSAGHSAVLALASAGLLTLRMQLPSIFSVRAEQAVALVLIGLGLRALWRARSGTQHTPSAPTATRARMPFAIGILHGMAGSGAFTVWLAGAAASLASAAWVVGTYALGMALGMCAAALLARRAFVQLGRHALQRALALSGGVSLAVGLWWLSAQ